MKRVFGLVALVCALALSACDGPSPSAGGSVHPKGWGGTPKGVVLPRPLLTVVPTATMYDAVAVGNIPTHPFAAAGYTAGLYVTYPHIRATSQHAVSIAIAARYHADCLDVEPGDAVPSEAGSWALADIHAGYKIPCLYSDLSEMPAVKASLARSLGTRWWARVFLWLAWYRGIPGLVSGYSAVQYWDHCLGRILDCSTVTLRFLSIAQPPYRAPKPRPPLPTCFHHPLAKAQCTALKRKVASWRRGQTATLRGLTAIHQNLGRNHCRKPYRRKVCVDSGRINRILTRRWNWYWRQIRTTTAKY